MAEKLKVVESYSQYHTPKDFKKQIIPLMKKSKYKRDLLVSAGKKMSIFKQISIFLMKYCKGVRTVAVECPTSIESYLK